MVFTVIIVDIKLTPFRHSNSKDVTITGITTTAAIKSIYSALIQVITHATTMKEASSNHFVDLLSKH